MSRNHLLSMILLFAEGDGSENATEYTVSVSEMVKHGKRDFRVFAENLKTGEVFKSPKDNAKILEVMPLEFWPAFVRQSLLVGPSDEQSVLF